MVDTPGSNERPAWVRFVVANNAKRQAPVVGLRVLVMMSAICLAITGIEWGSDTVLGSIAFVGGIIAALLMAALAVWQWRAISWLDRRDAWPKAG